MSHIRILFFTIIWKFCPELITNGYIYSAVSPLYKVISGKENFYLLDEDALSKFKLSHPNKKIEVIRFKGLGELSADQLAESTLDPETRTLRLITMDDLPAANKTITTLMGENITLRKQFLEKNAEKAYVSI